MSESVYYYLLLEAVTGWKKKVKTQLSEKTVFSELTNSEILKNQLRYPGWKLVKLHTKHESIEKIAPYFRVLKSAGFPYYYAQVYDDKVNESIYYTEHVDELIAHNNPEDIERALFNKVLPEEPNYLSNGTTTHDKVLIKLRPKTKKISTQLETCVLAYLKEKTDIKFSQIKKLIDEESQKYVTKQELTCQWDFPNYKPTSEAQHYKSPPQLAEGLSYFYNEGNTMYLGFERENLEPYVNDSCNWAEGTPDHHVANLVGAFDMIVASVSAKCRTKALSNQGKEAYFFGACGAMYYREQRQLPESIWGEVTE